MKITWKDFENTSNNFTVDFEDMCRIFFKYYYCKSVTTLLIQKANNPGLETNPICVNGERIGFQAKYFQNAISYSDILDSAEKIIKYYKDAVDRVILFCNKDINIDAKDYKKAVLILEQNGITLLPFCNRNILDVLNASDEYASIRALYFNKLTLTDSWFNNKLKQALDDLNPRFKPDLHVDDFDSQKHFDILFRNQAVEGYLNEIIRNAKEELKYIYEKKDLIKAIVDIIDSFCVPIKTEYGRVLEWYSLFDKAIQELNDEMEPLEEQLHKSYGGEINLSKDEKTIIYNKISVLRKILDVIESFNLKEDEHFKFINNKILIVEGDAGTGKSHLLGYEAEVSSTDKSCRPILLLGQKFIFDDKPQEQIMKVIGLNVSFDEFLLACEARGDLDNVTTVIMIDAINECQNYRMWKQYINEILDKIDKYNYIKLVCSIRTTYKEHILSDKLNSALKNGNISYYKLSGFKNNLSVAVPLFFNYYNIPITTAAFFNFEFENPLFLQTYCEAYNPGQTIGSTGIFSLYSAYVEKEENKIKEYNNITDDFCYGKFIINKVGKLFYDKNSNSVLLTELYNACKDISESKKYIDGFLKAKILVQYFYDSNAYVHISYERFTDYIVAKHILDRFNNYEELCQWIKDEFLKRDSYGFVRRYVEGQFAALSLLTKEKYGKEIISCLDSLSKTDNYGFYYLNGLIYEYQNSLLYRADKDINAEDYYNLIVPYIETNYLANNHLDLLIALSGRSCSLNMSYTTDWLMQFTLPERDGLWTTYINNKYVSGERIYYIVQYFLNGDLSCLRKEEKLLYGQLLSWFLTSSNRILRDNASRALIRILRNDMATITYMLQHFNQVNDPYVISRLYGCAYGAILQTTDKCFFNDEAGDLCDTIYRNVFNKEIVYPDILLRDYALNILEYCKYRGIELNFDIANCRPPYKSTNIPDISVGKLKMLYPELEIHEWLGTDAIKHSMAPEQAIQGFTGIYGDFGRYTFGSAIRYFKGVDVEKAFCYAYNYIVENLGYDNKLFSEYDRQIGYGRGRNNCHVERIGKKYQWIAMYHILAMVSDSCEVDDGFSEHSVHYKGSWNPYVRDFDPTITIKCSNHTEELNCLLNRVNYTSWDLNCDEWSKIDDASDFIQHIRITDNNGETWLALHFNNSDATGNDFNIERQSVGSSCSACLIKTSELKNFVGNLKNKTLWGNHIESINISERYNIFAREYVWSPAYCDEHGYDEFEQIEIEVGRKTVIKKLPTIKYEESGNEYSDLIVLIGDEERTVEEPIKKYIGSIKPCCQLYLWEEEYDYSKDEVIRISMPARFIVNKLKLKQEFDGVWTTRDGDNACVDFNLIKNSNVNGIYLKEKYLKDILDGDMSVVWLGIGEKQHTFGRKYNDTQFWSEISAITYFDEDGNLKQEKFIENKTTR